MITVTHTLGYELAKFRTVGGLAAWLSSFDKAGVSAKRGDIPSVDRRNIIIDDRNALEDAEMLICGGCYKNGRSVPANKR